MDTFDTTRILSKEMFARLQAVFIRMVGDNGRLDARGLKSIFDMFGASYTDADVMDLVVEMDPRNKSLDFTDFVTVMTRPLDDDVLDDLRDVFTVLDRHSRGYVDADDLAVAMATVVNTPISSITVRAYTALLKLKSALCSRLMRALPSPAPPRPLRWS